jgi:chemotaxis protein methyltransferase CheR
MTRSGKSFELAGETCVAIEDGETSMNEAAACQREYTLLDDDFEYMIGLVRKNTGIKLTTAKRELVYGRLAKRLRTLGLGSFSEYCKWLKEDREGELGHMVNAITTNLTSFFRENHHFEYLKNTLLPRLLEKRSRRLRFWSAGCSTGEEAYSLAITLKEVLPVSGGWDVRILATDLDTSCVERAREGVYPAERVNVLPQQRMRRWFRRGTGEQSGLVRVDPVLQELVTFKTLNLMHDWPMKGPFDAIFCRNVMIYFDKQTQKSLANRYADLLEDAGHLFLGHSESLYKVTGRFSLVGTTIYRKKS